MSLKLETFHTLHYTSVEPSWVGLSSSVEVGSGIEGLVSGKSPSERSAMVELIGGTFRDTCNEGESRSTALRDVLLKPGFLNPRLKHFDGLLGMGVVLWAFCREDLRLVTSETLPCLMATSTPMSLSSLIAESELLSLVGECLSDSTVPGGILDPSAK